MSASLDRITQVVSDVKTSVDAAIAKITDLQAQLSVAGDDSAALDALSATLEATKTALDAAVTPAAQ